MNKVTVMIYGHEYTITGERSEEEIRGIADRVNKKMKEASRGAVDNSQGGLAVLAALNLSEEFQEKEEEIERLKKEMEQVKQDCEAALKKEEEAKEKSQGSADDLRNKLAEKEEELRQQLEKVSEYENNFFDLQMENIKLKSELEKLKGMI